MSKGDPYSRWFATDGGISMTATIPSFHVSSWSKAKGDGEIFIANRKDTAHSGTFKVSLGPGGGIHFDPATDLYPTGTVTITVDLTDDSFNGTFTSTNLELMNSYGKYDPTIFVTGQCKAEGGPVAQLPQGCKFWLMIANNKKPNDPQTADVVGFIVDDRKGNRIAYGTGPVRSGDFDVAPPGD